MRLSTTALAAFRRHRSSGVWLFIVLLFVVVAERRLAEWHLNARTAAAALESRESLEGDEIRVRLIILNDDHAPAVPPAAATISVPVVHASAQCLDTLALGRPAPRGPPSLVLHV